MHILKVIFIYEVIVNSQDYYNSLISFFIICEENMMKLVSDRSFDSLLELLGRESQGYLQSVFKCIKTQVL